MEFQKNLPKIATESTNPQTIMSAIERLNMSK